MRELRTLADLGVDEEFFKIAPSPPNAREFTYYTFMPVGRLPVQSDGYWSLIGVRQLSGVPRLVEVRFLRIDEDMLDEEEWSDFEAVRDASGYLSLTPPELEGLMAFLRELVSRIASLPTGVAEAPQHFVRLSQEELAALGIFQEQIPWLHMVSDGEFYRYHPPVAAPLAAQIELLYVSGWSSQNLNTAAMSLGIMHYEAPRGDNATSGQIVEIASPTIILDDVALHQLVELLQQYAWPNRSP